VNQLDDAAAITPALLSNLTPLPRHPRMKYVAGRLCCDIGSECKESSSMTISAPQQEDCMRIDATKETKRTP